MIGRAKLAKDKHENAQIKENETLENYNKLWEMYISANREYTLNLNDQNLQILYKNYIQYIIEKNTVDLMLDDVKLFSSIIQVEENVDYIINHKDVFFDKIITRESIVKAIGENKYFKNCIKENDSWYSSLKSCEYAYEDWKQPVMTGLTKQVEEGTITVSGIGETMSIYPMWRAFDGKYSGDDTGYWYYAGEPGYLQIEFPYDLKIYGIDYYDQCSTDSQNVYLGSARLYTNSDKVTPIGNEFSASSSWQKVSISGIPENGIITNKIYFYKTSGRAGIGELKINAKVFIFR